ncbi:protein of unknown function [Pseudodesulfovibrio profundus]|uniref:RHS repeat-associated core domain-containing protein n=1 Tax=Pseudodesulfovibrio profundus TaxID=57320 RepID=A0A2C8FBL3_9BACT|nr:protein of unknown function [Pseudodesulfovibrio profundus]
MNDPDTGFVRFGWRDYDPDTGRWTAQDPIGDAGGDNDWYGYCLDDPVNGIDPLGLFVGSLAPFVRQGAEGSSDFVRNYTDMREANTVGADKYFHCKANYEASKRGPGGKAAAWTLSEARELYGQLKGDPKSRPLRIPFSRPCLALRTQFDVLTAPQLGLIPGLFLPFLAEMPDFGRTSPFRLAPVEQLFSN